MSEFTKKRKGGKGGARILRSLIIARALAIVLKEA